jgi:glucokinase
MKNQIVAVDIGGTHARFALATLERGQPPVLAHVVKMATAAHASLEAAWGAYASHLGQALPKQAALAVACPIVGDELKLTNNPWTIRQSTLPANLGLERHLLLNDFGAITHAIPHMCAQELSLVCGPDVPLANQGVVSVIGAGTGLGVAALIQKAGHKNVLETEGGHIGFAPHDSIDAMILERLQKRYLRVSIERVASGPGLAHIYEALAALEGTPVPLADDKTLWSWAISGEVPLARLALERFCMILGSAAGDMALAHGAHAVVLAGGLVPRFLEQLKQSGFAKRFCAKGRFEGLMESLPVYACLHPDPGLLGAAAAFGENL